MKHINKIFPWFFLCALLATSLALMISSSRQESAIMDELAHIPAGYGYVKYLDYRLNPEHPPLVKAIAALPLLFENLKFPTDKSPWTSDVNGQWAAGAQFLYESGNNADQIIQTARFGPMLLTLLLIILIYVWSKELIGRWWALLPTFLFSLSPTVLAHGHYVTTDVGAALGIFAATYYFIKYLTNPDNKHLVYAGLAFGIAQLMKFSAVLLIPFFAVLAIIFPLIVFREKKFISLIKCLVSTLVIGLIGFALVYAVYFVFTMNYPMEKQVSDTTYILTSFGNGPDTGLSTCKGVRCLADLNIKIAGNKIARPFAQYMLGVLMVLQRSSGGNTSYFLDQVSAAGWWYYFPIVFVLKEQIASLILMVLSFILALWHILKAKSYKLQAIRDYLSTYFAEFSMMFFVAFYWIYSIKSPLNIGVRHILPTIPFIYILTTSGLRHWFNNGRAIGGENIWDKTKSFAGVFLKFSLKGTFIGVLLVWYLAETLFVYPNFLSYFNEFAGGTQNGYRMVTDSNYDWGQDLKKLEKFVYNPPAGIKIDKIAVDYFGGGSQTYYMNDKTEPWQSSKGNPADNGIHWFAVSINNLQGAIGALAPGQNRNPEDEYQWLTKIRNPYQPDYRAGTSIFIYKL